MCALVILKTYKIIKVRPYFHCRHWKSLKSFKWEPPLPLISVTSMEYFLNLTILKMISKCSHSLPLFLDPYNSWMWFFNSNKKNSVFALLAWTHFKEQWERSIWGWSRNQKMELLFAASRLWFTWFSSFLGSLQKCTGQMGEAIGGCGMCTW